MKTVIAFIRAEPVYIQAAIVAAIATGSAFGLGWTGPQVAAVTGLSAAILAVICRQAVSPFPPQQP
jgi:hypothetical protein